MSKPNVFEIGIEHNPVKWPAERRGQVLTKIVEGKIQEYVTRCKSVVQQVTLINFFQIQMSDKRFPEDVPPVLLLDVGLRVNIPFYHGQRFHDVMFTIRWPTSEEEFLAQIKKKPGKFLSSEVFHNYNEFDDLKRAVVKLDEKLDLLHEFGAYGSCDSRSYLGDRLEQDLRLEIKAKNQQLVHLAWQIVSGNEFKREAATVIRDALREAIQAMTEIVRPAVEPHVLHELIDESYVKDIMDE